MPLSLTRIGQLLQEAREQQGLTVEEVSKALFIRKRVIGALEAGDWANLPHPVYVKGYLTQYAAFLKVADLFESEMASKEVESSGPEDGNTRKKGILGWQFRKKKPQAKQAVNVPWSVIDQL